MFKNNLKKFLISFSIVIFVFFLDRITKLYILNLAESEKYVDIYFNSFLNFYLIWNKGIGFGLFQLESSFFYNFITALIIIINIIILVMIIKSKDYKIFFLLMILGGSSGNLFDRLYFKAVPDFIDLHYESFHWFIFNVADIFISIGLICLIIAEFILNNKKDNEKN
tara:strand:+ start:190 stop:690 length:501 start_codon:yes stop_codon:yes gene_type:complete